jgi:CheY-like chemotaxis protein
MQLFLPVSAFPEPGLDAQRDLAALAPGEQAVILTLSGSGWPEQRVPYRVQAPARGLQRCGDALVSPARSLGLSADASDLNNKWEADSDAGAAFRHPRFDIAAKLPGKMPEQIHTLPVTGPSRRELGGIGAPPLIGDGQGRLGTHFVRVKLDPREAFLPLGRGVLGGIDDQQRLDQPDRRPSGSSQNDHRTKLESETRRQCKPGLSRHSHCTGADIQRENLTIGFSAMGTIVPPTNALKDMRILVVENEALIAMLVEDELLDAGALIVGSASSVAEALRMIKAAMGDGGISAAVLDLNLDGEAVWPVANALDELGVPFLFETGYGLGCNIGKYVTAPILHKPFDPQALIGAVEGLVIPGR